MAERVVRGACPHDCPDTCAMLVTVDEEGRATHVAGDPEHPITAGFLCGKVSNYLDRVYADDRLLHPLIRTGEKGAGDFRQVSWDEALDAVAEGFRGAIDGHGGESLLPYSYMGTQGFVQGELMGTRLMNALGGSKLERTICASAGIAGVLATHGVSPEVDPELWHRARYVIVWAWNPMSTAPHLWRKLLDARRAGAKLVVIDPYRSRTARVADVHLRPNPGTDGALALGMMRAVVDEALADEEWCRAHATGYDELLERLGERTVDEWVEPCGVDADEVREVAIEFARTQPALLRLGVGGQRHAGAPIAYRTVACLPALVGAWRHPGGGCSYVPTATAGAVSAAGHLGEELLAEPVRTINMSQLGQALTDPDLDPPVKALVVWNSNPGQIAPDQERVLEGLRRDDLFCVVLEQFMTDTAAHADVVLPATTQLEHLDALFSWGHHYMTWNEPAVAPRGEAKPNSEIFRLIAARMGIDHPLLRQSDEEILAGIFAGTPVDAAALRERGWLKVDLGLGETPHADGGFVTASGKLEFNAAWMTDSGLDALPFFDPPAEVCDPALEERYPLSLVTPKTHLYLNSTFPNQSRQHSAQPEPELVLHPRDAEQRGIADGAMVRGFNDRGAFTCRARVSDDTRPGVVVAPMGWWKADWPDGRAAQATTSQRLTKLGNAPTFNDNRVELEPA
jgi:anaerobic selenocysteine-containing dehydrogenase